MIPQKYLDLFEDDTKAFATLATLMPDGSPQVTPVWFDYKDGKVRINTARGRVKEKNMTLGARVAMAIVDPRNPYRYIQVRGKVAAISEEGADDHINSLSMKYMGQDRYPFARPGEVRVIYTIEPTSVQSMG